MVEQAALNRQIMVRFHVDAPLNRALLWFVPPDNPCMPNTITLDTKLDSVSGIPPKLLAKLKKLELVTVRDLLWHFPSRYEDYSKVVKIIDLKEGESITVRAEVKKISVRPAWNRRMMITEALLTDETGGVTAVWFNQPYIGKILKPGVRANFAGKMLTSKLGTFLSNPSYEVLRGTSETRHTAGLIPVYPETRGLTSKGFRYLIKQFLNILGPMEDFLPETVREANHLPGLSLALKHIHFPRTLEQAREAQQRFAFEYLFLLQLYNQKIRGELAKEKAPTLKLADQDYATALKLLPFTLTEAQNQSLREIIADLGRGVPMNRLLQGDVGSGKTVVAALAALIAAKNNYQAVFMAPTEVLARQHYKTLTSIFNKAHISIALLTAGEARVFHEQHLEQKKSKPHLIKDIEAGVINIVIGTHALITKDGGKKAVKIKFHNLGLVIVDEQHRFGVDQRAALLHKKSGLLPHFLSMSATPIPRTLALTVFGDLELSTINELPKGRKEIITKIVDPKNRPRAYEFIREQIEKGRQAFFIYPRIEIFKPEETEKGDTKDKRVLAWSEAKAVKAEYERLAKTVFPDLSVAMLHGKLKASEKADIMTKFKSGETDLLVSTSVVEVGVDVPNATIMVIEGAEHFGLASLYQFRGRVGRGEHQSFCLLFTESTSETTTARLNALLEAKNGFELAEKDLQLRGPGEFLGDKQTGTPDFAMSALGDSRLIKIAQDAAKEIVAGDPELNNHLHLKTKVERLKQEVHLE